MLIKKDNAEVKTDASWTCANTTHKNYASMLDTKLNSYPMM